MANGPAAAISALTPAPTAPKVTGYDCRIVEQGPLFVEAVVEYKFDNGGYYRFIARAIVGEPMVRIDEQYDLKHIDESQWLLRLMYTVGSGKAVNGQSDLALRRELRFRSGYRPSSKQ